MECEIKVCTKCKEEKPLSEFYNSRWAKDGKKPSCKSCNSISFHEYRRKPEVALRLKAEQQLNKEKYNKGRRERYFKNHEEELAKRKIKRFVDKEKSIAHYRENREFFAAKSRRIYEKNKEKIFEKRKNKYQLDPEYRVRTNLSNRLRCAVKGNKNASIMKYLGCSVGEFKPYLESKFQEGMSWDNYNKHGWHIDHIIPLCLFNLSNENCRYTAFHYSNMQPLWAADNIRKGGSYL